MSPFSIRQLHSASERLLEDVEGIATGSLLNYLRYNAIRLGCLLPNAHEGWSVPAPRLILLPDGKSAVWAGGMCPSKNRILVATAEKRACHASITARAYAPPLIKLSGCHNSLIDVAAELSIDCYENGQFAAALDLDDLEIAAEEGRNADPPTHNVETFNIERLAWESTDQQYTIREGRLALRTKTTSNVLRYYLIDHGGCFRCSSMTALPADNERFAILWASKGRDICSYDPAANTFTSKIKLPSYCAVPLCLCTGELPVSNGSKGEVYKSIPSAVGNRMLRVFGQNFVPDTFIWF